MMKKRIISLLLAFVMTFSLLPTMAWAADNDCSAAGDGSVTWPYDADTTTTVTAKTLDSEHSATCQVTVLPVSSEGEAAQKPGNTDKPVNTNNAEQQEDAVLDEEASKENEEKNKTVLVTSLSIVESVPILTVGTPYSLDNLQLKFTPEDATNTNVTWSSDDESVVTVADGVITPIAEGETWITAKTVDGSEQSAQCKVTVEAPVSIKSIQITFPLKQSLQGFSFSPDVTTYEIAIADGVGYSFVISPDSLPQNKNFFAQLYKDGQPIMSDNGVTIVAGTYTLKGKLTVGSTAEVKLLAKNGPELGTSGEYSILIGTKKNDTATADFTKVYCTYNFKISTNMPGLKTLAIMDEKNTAITPTPKFSATNVYTKDYSVVVPASSSYIYLTATAKTTGVKFRIGETTYNQLTKQKIALEGFATDTPLVYRIPIQLQKTADFTAENTYYLTVTKKNPMPVILAQSGESTDYVVAYEKGENAPLSVTVKKPEEGELSYQWFSRASGTYKAIPDATEPTYIPDTSRAGSILYKCTVANTLDGTPYSVDTKDITVKVNLTSVDKPEILLQPGSFTVQSGSIVNKYKTEYAFGETLNQIFIALDDPESGEVYSYKWYYNTERSTENGIPLEESHIGSSKTEGKYCQGFTISHKFEPGTYYLYCEVTASSESNPELSAMTVSEPVEILFNKVHLSDFEGSGTEDDPFLIQSVEDLQKLSDLIEDRQYCTGLKFLMTTDLTLPEDWQPIGRIYNNDEVGKGLPYMGFCVFRGIFDGGNHTLTIAEGGKPLFHYVSAATIQNLNIYGSKIDGYGLIDGWFTDYGEDNKWNYGDPYCVTIDNVKLLSGSQTLYSGFLGGSGSGINTVTIRNSTIEKGVVVGYDREQNNIGSFVGGAFNGVIENSVSYADVYGKNEVGGLAAGKGQTMGLCAVRNSQFHGNIVATGSKVGGIIARGYADVGERSAWNSPWVTVEGCTVTGSITGGNYVGGIFGVEDCTVQCWGNDFGEDDFSANSSGRIRNNRFEGTIHSTGKYVGGIVGYIEALNRYSIVSNNYYRAECGVDTGIGYVRYVDTSCKTHETSSGAIYFNTSESLPGIQGVSQKNCNRTDDPLGADREKLCYTDKPIENYVEELVLSGTYKTVYEVGDAFDLTGMEFSAKWKDGTIEKLSTDKITFTGFSTAEAGVKGIIAEYKGATKIFTITVKPKSTKITVTISVLGDSAHGDNGQVHGLAMGGLQPWISATEYEADASETLWQVLKRVFDAHGFDYSNSSGNYISSINGLAEFTNGKNSGWMYTLNGKYPMLGVSEQYLKQGDVIVFHYTDDYTLEAADMGPAPEEKKTADEVIALINAIGVVDLTKGDVIAKARTAYDALSAADKKLVTNYQTLLDAEAAYAKLVAELGKKADSIYKTTGDYLAKLGTPGVGSIGGEWMALGLARSGRTVPEGYYDAVVKYVKDNIDSNGRLDKNKATENARIILALTAIGKDATNVDGHDLLAGLNEMSYLSKQGINGAIFTLIALDSHSYTPAGDVTRDKLVQVILDAQISNDGGWSLDGKNADVDMTAMAIQALAAYYKSNSSAKKAVDKGLSWLSSVQQNDGGFTSWGAANSESCAQVIVALTALGIDPAKDSRFIKNGVSVLDALCSFAVNGGGFKHLATETSANGMATEQGFYALVAYYRLLNGQTSLYDMTDVKLEGVKAEEPVDDTDKSDDTADTEVEDTSSGGQVVLWVVIGVVAVGGIAALAVTSKKRHGRDAE